MNRERKVEEVFEGMVLNTYPSLTAASQQTGISLSTLHRLCNKGITYRFHNEFIADENWQKHPYLELECSDCGRIKLPTGKLTWGSPGLNGYLYVYLTKPKRSTRLVSRLVAETFIPNPDQKPTVDHIDRIRTNNHILNLRWATMKEQGHNKNKYTKDRKPYPKNRKSRIKDLPINPILG
jgi:hypothetical protein